MHNPFSLIINQWMRGHWRKNYEITWYSSSRYEGNQNNKSKPYFIISLTVKKHTEVAQEKYSLADVQI